MANGQFSATGTGGSYGNFTLSNGNLTVTTTADPSGAKAAPFLNTGKKYFEVTPNSGVPGQGFFVVGLATQAITNGTSVFPATTSSVVGLSGNGNIYIAFVSQGISGPMANGAATCIAVDLGAALIWFRQGAGNWNNNVLNNPVTGVGGINIASVLANGDLAPFIALATSSNIVATGNLGGAAFAQTIPVGFTAWFAGSTYNDAVAETVTATDTVAASSVLGATTTETSSSVDTVSALQLRTGTVAETSSLTDTVSVAASTWIGVVGETASALDTLDALEIDAVDVAEALNATDTVTVPGVVLHTTIAEVAVAQDVVASHANYNVNNTELASAEDTVSSRKYTRKWFLSFAQVVPPPAGQGPGNPGKLFGSFRLEEVE